MTLHAQRPETAPTHTWTRRSARTGLSCTTVATLALAAAGQGTTLPICVSTSGVASNGDTLFSGVSGDGRYVVFVSSGNNLVAGDTNNFQDVFLRDTQLGTTTRVSVKPNGTQLATGGYAPAISNDGSAVVFRGGPSGLSVRDLVLSTTEAVNVNTQGALGVPEPSLLYYPAAISATGRFVAFPSGALNLVAGDTNQADDIFLRDRVAGTTELVSVNSAGVQGNGDSSHALISGDARFVAFDSLATNLVSNDANAWRDVFVRDRLLGTTERVTVNSSGLQGHFGGYGPSLSADGRFVAFESRSIFTPGDLNGVEDVFVRDRWLGVTQCVSARVDGVVLGGSTAALSPDGRFVAFESDAGYFASDTNGLVDILVKDRATGAVRAASRAPTGAPANGASTSPSLSNDGRRVVFSSGASNLVSGDLNAVRDIFLYELAPAAPEVYCTAKASSLGCTPSISASGTPSASSLAAFDVHAQGIVSHAMGLLCYSLAGHCTPFQGGWLCLAQPLTRTGLRGAGGNPGALDCSGSFAFDFNAWIQSGVDPMLAAGTVVDVQYVYRDAGDPTQLGLSDALHFAIGN